VEAVESRDRWGQGAGRLGLSHAAWWFSPTNLRSSSQVRQLLLHREISSQNPLPRGMLAKHGGD